MEMNDQELEKILMETLRISKENREYLIKIDRRQRWGRNWTVFYWALLVVFAVFGTYYAFPYLKTVHESVSSISRQVTSFVDFAQPMTKE
jgi:predicted MFS family arabinose efflux permease